MSAKPSNLWTDIDFDRDGKQFGWIHLHHSVTRSAYGDILIPIVCIRNGPGKTLFLMSGNHGDEYEGQVVTTRLAQELDPATLEGRVIIMPAANLPAALAGTRVSPIDGGNFNRSFPGDADGPPTSRIAHYVTTVLMPMADAFIDLHSGGASLDYLPFCSMRISGDARLDARSAELLEAFAPPLAFVWAYSQAGGGNHATTAAFLHGVPNLGGEFGGGGGFDPEGYRIANTGVLRALHYLGILSGAAPVPVSATTRKAQVKGRDYFVFAPENGVFEPLAQLGDRVKTGDLAGRVWFSDNPKRAPESAYFLTDGFVVCRRAMNRCERGDCLYHLATDLTE